MALSSGMKTLFSLPYLRSFPEQPRAVCQALTIFRVIFDSFAKYSLLQNNVTLAIAPYRVQSSVTLSLFREFISELEGVAVNITEANLTGLQRLREAFRFEEFAAKFREFRPLMGLKEAEDVDVRGRITAFEEKPEQHDSAIAVLQDKVRQLSTDSKRRIGEACGRIAALEEKAVLLLIHY
jgi:hypothetical protein